MFHFYTTEKVRNFWFLGVMEAAVFWMFLKISQYSPENTYVRIFFEKVAGLKACNFIKKRLKYRCFPVNIAKFLRTVFFIGNLLWCYNNGALA